MTTQKAFASYQEIIDLHTESNRVSVIGIHTPSTSTPRKMFGGFFDQFKKFKYVGCSISLVPAARLPADPLQVSAIYDDESPFQSIDPRDMLNPIMFHGCHGNDMGTILNRLYALNSLDAKKSDSVFQYEIAAFVDGDTPLNDLAGFQLEDLYYKALTDNTWRKAHPQRGFRKTGLRPLVYSMATNMQFNNSVQGFVNDSFGVPTEPEFDIGGSVGSETVQASFGIDKSALRVFTPRLQGLGWLDTRNVLSGLSYSAEVPLTDDYQPVVDMANQGLARYQSDADLPLIYMGIILMPPAYKTEQYFRMIIHHHFAFKEFRGISFSNSINKSPAYSDFNVSEEDGDDEPTPPVPPVPEGDDDALFGYSGTVSLNGRSYETYKYFRYNGVVYSLPNNQYSSSVFLSDWVPGRTTATWVGLDSTLSVNGVTAEQAVFNGRLLFTSGSGNMAASLLSPGNDVLWPGLSYSAGTISSGSVGVIGGSETIYVSHYE